MDAKTQKVVVVVAWIGLGVGVVLLVKELLKGGVKKLLSSKVDQQAVDTKIDLGDQTPRGEKPRPPWTPKVDSLVEARILGIPNKVDDGLPTKFKFVWGVFNNASTPQRFSSQAWIRADLFYVLYQTDTFSDMVTELLQPGDYVEHERTMDGPVFAGFNQLIFELRGADGTVLDHKE